MKQSINLREQQGATLIVVLLVLLLVMVAGALAVRQSRTDLQVATSDQINTVLLQTADNANQKLETIINGDTSNADYQKLVENTNGFIGYFYSDDTRDHQELIYCQTGSDLSYLVNSATIKSGTGTIGAGSGYCANGSNMRYTSSRDVMVSQVSIQPVNEHSSVEVAPLSGYATGQDINSKTSKSKEFEITSIAAIPAYSGRSGVNTCFSGSTETRDIASCLEERGVPQTQVYQLADISHTTTAQACVDFGSSSAPIGTDSSGATRLLCLN